MRVKRQNAVGGLAIIFTAFFLLAIAVPPTSAQPRLKIAETSIWHGFPSGTYIGGVQVLDGYAYVSTTSGRLEILDVRNPAQPEWLKQYDPGKPAWAPQLARGDLFLAAEGGLMRLDIHVPTRPLVLAAGTNGDVSAFQIVGDVACVALRKSIQLIDVKDRTALPVLGEWDPDPLDYILDVRVIGQFAYAVLDHDPGFTTAVINIQDPTRPQLHVSLPDPIVFDFGGRPAVQGTNGELQIYRGAPPDWQVDATYRPWGTVWAIDMIGRFACLTELIQDVSALEVVDTSDPQHPVRVKFLRNPAAGVATQVVTDAHGVSPWWFVTGWENGLGILPTIPGVQLGLEVEGVGAMPFTIERIDSAHVGAAWSPWIRTNCAPPCFFADPSTSIGARMYRVSQP